MTIERLQHVHRAEPFKPFTLHLADGKNVHVPHREFLSHSPGGRTVIVYGDGERFDILDVLMITRIEVLDRKAGSKRNGKKH
jgi:hypothetical protein